MPRPAGKTRRRILESAYELFYRKGFSRVGVDEIAAFAGITKRSLYYHFESKDELLAAVLDLHHELAAHGAVLQWRQGLQRSDQIGSVSTQTPPICNRNVEWPMKVSR